jgi:hypothetical protein
MWISRPTLSESLRVALSRSPYVDSLYMEDFSSEMPDHVDHLLTCALLSLSDIARHVSIAGHGQEESD